LADADIVGEYFTTRFRAPSHGGGERRRAESAAIQSYVRRQETVLFASTKETVMRIRFFWTPIVPLAFMLSSYALPAAAQPASALVRVNACNPSLNVSRTGGWVGYAPGFWGGPWYDPWGVRYYAPAMTSTSPQLGIDYVNTSPRVMNTIEFGLVANGILKAEVRDVGTFSPGAEIKHAFPLSPNVFPIGTGLARCVPLRIKFADGTKWRNPRLPHKNTHIYLHP
jgi:hypothetical protein